MRQDLKMHLAGGAIACAVFVALTLVAIRVHPALACAMCGPIFGWGVEQYQRVRKEGTPSKVDALATAAPFWLAAVVWYVVA